MTGGVEGAEVDLSFARVGNELGAEDELQGEEAAEIEPEVSLGEIQAVLLASSSVEQYRCDGPGLVRWYSLVAAGWIWLGHDRWLRRV